MVDIQAACLLVGLEFGPLKCGKSLTTLIPLQKLGQYACVVLKLGMR